MTSRSRGHRPAGRQRLAGLVQRHSDEEIAPELRRQLGMFAASYGADQAGVPLGVIKLYAACWVRLYGLVAIEIFGHVHFMLEDAEPLFEAELAELGRVVGIRADGSPITDEPAGTDMDGAR